MMKKSIILAALLGAGAFALQAAEPCLIKGADDKEIHADSIVAQPSGDLEYANGKIKSKIGKGKYKYAWIPKPKAIADADADLAAGKLSDAAAKYKKAYDSYKLLGWDVYCGVKEAESLFKLDRKEDALKRLEEFKAYKLANPRLERDLMDAYKLTATIQIEAGNTAAAEPMLDEMVKSREDEIAAFAFTRKGDLLLKQGAKKDAVLMYLQAVLLFPKSPMRAESLLKAANTLSELKDPRSVKFADMLKAEYPSDPLVKELKK